MQKKDTTVTALCEELGITKYTLYRYVAPDGSLRPQGKQLVGRKK
jgi:hypothetical protein